MSPKVSVIIPAYNCGPLVTKALESVRRQTYQDFEVIVVDDGSSDDTWRVLQDAAAGWDKVRAIHAEHKGLAAARNRAIAEMKGQYIALLDADDLWQPDKLHRCMEFLDSHPDLSIVYTPMAPFKTEGRIMPGHSKPCHRGQITEKLFLGIFVHDPASVFHRRVIDECGGFDESLPVCVGHEFWLRVSTRFEFGLIDEPLALRRWSEGSLTRSNRSRGRRIKAGMLERFYFEKGGDKFISREKAFPRLGRVFYSTGKILMKERDFGQAREYLKKARQYDPGNIKLHILGVFCRLAMLVGLGGRDSGNRPGRPDKTLKNN